MTNLSSSDLAAWVQAIGTIITIGVALFVVILQHNLEKVRTAKSQQDLITRYLATVISLAGGLKEKAGKLAKWCAAGGTNQQDLYFMLREVDAINNALNSFPIWELETFDLIVNVVSIQALSNTLLRIVHTAESLASNSGNWVQATNSKLPNTDFEITGKLFALTQIEKSRAIIGVGDKTSILSRICSSMRR